MRQDDKFCGSNAIIIIIINYNNSGSKTALSYVVKEAAGAQVHLQKEKKKTWGKLLESWGHKNWNNGDIS